MKVVDRSLTCARCRYDLRGSILCSPLLPSGLLHSPLLHDWESQEEAIVCGSLNVHSGSKASFGLRGITIHVVCC
jgi:hypothetical protein